MEEIGTIRVHGDTYSDLKEIKGDDETVEDVVSRLLEQDVKHVIERPEEETVGLAVDKDLAKKVNQKAGENVSANDVIETLIEQYQDDENI